MEKRNLSGHFMFLVTLLACVCSLSCIKSNHGSSSEDIIVNEKPSFSGKPSPVLENPENNNVDQTSGAPIGSDKTSPDQEISDTDEIWFCHGYVDGLFDKSQWDSVCDQIDGIKVYVGWIENASDDSVKQFVAMLKENDIKLAVEIGGTLEFMPLDETNGEESAALTIEILRKILKAGGTIDYLDMDGPIRRIMHPFDELYAGLTLEESVNELVDFMTEMRKLFLTTEFYILTNFPNWGYKGGPAYHAIGPDNMLYGDYFTVINKVINETTKAGIPLAGITVDNPYDYAVGEHESIGLDPKSIDWIGRIKDLEAIAKNNGLKFSVIFNSEKGGFQFDALFYEDTLKFIEVYEKSGGDPDIYMIQSWYKHPSDVVPEEQVYSMTNLVKEVINNK
ncbi:MAG: hypothetical protein HY606_06135 [Planctomycetes bacterium]|nr:hypothetical protein [Planctomycetota bacterium]